MPSTPWIPAVKVVKDGTDVSAATLNPVLSQHTQREQHLKELFDELLNKSVLVAYDQPILDTDFVKKNSVVFYDRSGSDYGLELAKTDFAQSSKNTTSYTPSNSSYSFGIVSNISTSTDTADVFLLGLVEFEVDMNLDSVDNPSILQSSDRVAEDDVFEPGPLFLSRTEAGKLTRNPGGVAIFVGYAVSRTQLMLSPDVTEFNQFFTSFRYNILDRPAGEPYFDEAANSGDGGWTLVGTAADNKKHIGWVPVTEEYVGTEIWENHVPVDEDDNKPSFFYNLPSAANISEDTGVEADERAQQLDLSATLPPNPVNFTLFTVNGIIQANTDLDKYGVYTINEVGLWWWKNYANETPWAEDIPASLEVTFSGDEITYEAPHGHVVGDVVVFSNSGGALPSPFVADTAYYVTSISGTSGAETIITVAETDEVGAAEITAVDGGTGTHSVKQPYIWKGAKGSEIQRPKMLLQFLKFNPSLGESIVTSLKKFNSGSNIIRFFKSNKTTEATRGTGDLLARILLTYTAGTALESSSTGLVSLSYNETTGVTETISAPMVSKIIAGDGVSVTELTVGGVRKEGQFIISNNNNTQSGRVSYIEPDGAELIYSGLHSYLEMPYPTVLPSSFIGKIVLPAGGPSSDLKLIFMMIGSTALASNASNKIVNFDFSYSVTKPGTALTAAATPIPIEFNIPTPTTGYVAKTCFKIGPGLSPSTFSLAVNELIVPATSFIGGDCAINFKLTRKTPSSNGYAYPIGIVDMYWKIG